MNKKIGVLGAAAIFMVAVNVSAASVEAKALYEKHCLKCHGANGDGKGKAGTKLKPAPTDFTTEKSQKRTDDQIFEATKLGSKAKSIEVSKKMPAYSSKLTDEQIKEQVKLIREFGAKK
jgi:mono/diheme cytochrome c family protein